MPLPQGFNSSEHLQDLVRRFSNREVRDYFSDVGDANWPPDVSTPRGSLRVGCTHQDADSLLITLLRLHLFDMVRNLGADVPYYGIPVGQINEQRRFRPQIKLWFQEDLDDIEPGFTPTVGEISVRLMDQDSDSITPAIAQNLATKVRTNFATANGRIWRKGKTMAAYTEWERGYQFQLLVRAESDARALIDAALDIQGHSPRWEHLNISESVDPSAAFPTIPGNQRIYGRQRRSPRRRPVADVRFRTAFLHIWGMPKPIVLVDLTGRQRQALIRV